MYIIMKFVGLTLEQFAKLKNVLDSEAMTTKQPVDERKTAQLLRVRYVIPGTGSNRMEEGIMAEVKVWVVRKGSVDRSYTTTNFNLHTARKVLDEICEAIGAFPDCEEKVEETAQVKHIPPEPSICSPND
jgi:hypothetical protein